MDIPSVIKTLQYRVLVKCMTYNQHLYIQDALNGFSIQQTDFPFVCLVMDDASTDGEQDVIHAFLDRECDMEHSSRYEIEEANVVISQHTINKNCTFAVYFLKKNLYGNPKKDQLRDEWRKYCKYEALCEGDDYWIDPLKLQKQVDFLESNREYSMCCSDAEILGPEGVTSWTRYKESQMVIPEDMIKGGGLYVQTASLLYRTKLWEDYPSYCKNCHVGDFPLKIWGAVNGGLYWFAEKMVVYRYMAAGSWTSRMISSNITSLIPRWRSEVEMLKGIDDYSKHKYRGAIEFRLTEFIYNKMLIYQENWSLIADSFPDCVALFSFKKKVVNYIMTHNFLWIIKIWRKIKCRN